MHNKATDDNFYHWQGDDLLLFAKVNPRSSRNQMEPSGAQLKIKITTPPIDGKANKHLTKYLAKIFAVAASQVIVEKGAHNAQKKIRVIQPKKLPAFINK